MHLMMIVYVKGDTNTSINIGQSYGYGYAANDDDVFVFWNTFILKWPNYKLFTFLFKLCQILTVVNAVHTNTFQNAIVVSSSLGLQ